MWSAIPQSWQWLSSAWMVLKAMEGHEKVAGVQFFYRCPLESKLSLTPPLRVGKEFQCVVNNSPIPAPNLRH